MKNLLDVLDEPQIDDLYESKWSGTIWKVFHVDEYIYIRTTGALPLGMERSEFYKQFKKVYP